MHVEKPFCSNMDFKIFLGYIISTGFFFLTAKLLCMFTNYEENIFATVCVISATVLMHVFVSNLISKASNFLVIICDAICLFLTFWALNLVSLTTTFILKTESVTSSVLAHIWSGKPMSKLHLLCFPFIIAGISMFERNISLYGVCLIILSNLIDFIKKEKCWEDNSKAKTKFQVGYKIIICAIAVSGIIWILNYTEILETTVAIIISLSFLNTFLGGFRQIQCQQINLDSISRANIIESDFFVLLLLLSTEYKHFGVFNLCGMVVYILGISLHNFIKGFLPKRDDNLLQKQIQYKEKGLQLVKYCLLVMLALHISSSSLKISPLPSPEHRKITMDHRSTYSKNILEYQNSHESWAKIFDLRSRPILLNPEKTNAFVQTLTDTKSVINEIQRIHFNIFEDLLKPYKYVFLMDISHTESKGDPAITIGEILLIQRLGKKLVHYCSEACCTDPNLAIASQISSLYSKHELVILFQGGGNLIGWATHDVLRSRVFKHLSGFHFIMFPQTVFKESTQEHLEFCKELYRNQENLTMLFRDEISFELGRKYFQGKARLILAPDMAFQLGPKPRIMDPAYDIVWLRRVDKESPGYDIPKGEFPPEITYKSLDWAIWLTEIDNTNAVSNAVLFVHSGFTYLQRGRVVITDRLHGHIFSVLMDIPHVIIGNKYKKIDGFHETWTKSLQNVRIANNASHAIVLALELLRTYDNILPPKLPFMKIHEPCLKN